jgi:hypothetical protein
MTNYVQTEMRPSQLEHNHSDMFDYKSKPDESNNSHGKEFDLLQENIEQTNQVRSQYMTSSTHDNNEHIAV